MTNYLNQSNEKILKITSLLNNTIYNKLKRKSVHDANYCAFIFTKDINKQKIDSNKIKERKIMAAMFFLYLNDCFANLC